MVGGCGGNSGVGRSEASSIYMRPRVGISTTWITPCDEHSLARSEDPQNQCGICLRIGIRM